MPDLAAPSAEDVTEAFLGALAASSEAGSDHALLGGIAVDLYAGPRRTQADVLRELREDSMTALWRGPVRLDLLEANDPLHAEALRQKTSVRALGRGIPVVRAEHLLVTKWIAGRPKDLIDVDQVLAAQGPGLDLSILRAWLAAIEKSGGGREVDFEDRVRRLVRGEGGRSGARGGDVS